MTNLYILYVPKKHNLQLNGQWSFPHLILLSNMSIPRKYQYLFIYQFLFFLGLILVFVSVITTFLLVT